jgi:hypothetical protein
MSRRRQSFELEMTVPVEGAEFIAITSGAGAGDVKNFGEVWA